MKHAPATPLPWSTHESVMLANVEVGSEGNFQQTLWLNKKADAAYIAHAANAYPKLVAALCDCAVAVTRDGMQASAARADLLLRELGEDE